MKIAFITLMASIYLSFTTYLSVTKLQETSGQIGFYVNSGKKEIKKMDCYDFDNLTLKIKITPEMSGYDIIYIGIACPTKQTRIDTYDGKVSMVYYEVPFDNKVFKAKYTGSTEISILVFPELSNNNMEESFSPFLKRSDNQPPRRVFLQYMDKDDYPNAVLKGYITGGTITGTEERVDPNSSSGRLIKSNTYKFTPILTTSIPLENRVMISHGKKDYNWIPKTVQGNESLK